MKKFLFLLLLSPFLISSYDYEDAAFGPASYPVIGAYWQDHPTIKVCKILRISKTRVEKALDYWRRLGYTFEEVIYDDESISCAGRPMYGEIIITIPGQDFDYRNIAITRRTMVLPQIWFPGDDHTNDNMGALIYAKIFLQEKEVTKERVLEHEIGHALGWDHTARRYHLMHKNWESGGHDSTGLKYERYQELYELIKLMR
jgi:hypothetical protein